MVENLYPISTCEVCGDEFEPYMDSYCGHQFIESDTCRRCAEDDGKPDVAGGWDEDVCRDR